MQTLNIQTTPLEDVIRVTTEVLSSGGLVIYPTETTYGVGVDVENQAAVDKLLTYKGQRDGKPISVAVATRSMAERYVTINEVAENIYAQYLPGPVTVVSHGTGIVASGIASPEGKVGIRIPAYPTILSLLASYGRGITATGANASNKKRPYAVNDIYDSISASQRSLIDLVLDAGTLPPNEPSTVIDTTLDDLVVLRHGKLQFQTREAVVSRGIADTQAIAAALIRRYRSYLTYKPLIISLEGHMGAGKTHFVQGIAKALGVTDSLTSPTYTLCNEYSFVSEERRAPLLHVDTWKMTSPEEFSLLGIPEQLHANPVIAIEWGERITGALQEFAQESLILRVEIGITGPDTRSIIVSHPQL